MSAEDISAKARRIHFSSLVFDAHADTPQRFFFDRFDLGSRDTEGSVDIPAMREGGIGAIFFALWVPVEITGPLLATRRAFDLLNAVEEQIRLHPDDLMLAHLPKKSKKHASKKGLPCYWVSKAATPSMTIWECCENFRHGGSVI